MVHKGTLNLNPEYQRDVVWPIAKMEGLIQSLFLVSSHYMQYITGLMKI